MLIASNTGIMHDFNHLISQLDARGETVSLGYDSLNRLIEKNSSEDSIDYSYDTVIGTLSSVSGNFGSIAFDYDNRLRMTDRNITLDGTTFNTHYSYDSQDRVLSKAMHDGIVIDYSYDKQGLLDSIGSVVDNIDYTAAGLKSLISYGNGLDSEYNYSYNRLSRLKTSSLQDLNYEYDSVGNILEINNKINSKNRSMTYDDLDRLITADYTDYDMTYSYNIIGNMISVDGTKDAEYSYDSGPAHAPSSAKLGNRFVFKDSSGDITAVLGDDGSIYLAGTLYESSSQSLSANDEFVIKNDGDEVFILDSETGNLYIDENVHENSGTISSDASQDEFMIKNHNADIVLLVNESGSVFSIGEVFESHTAFETLNYDANGNLIQDNTQYYEYNAFNQLERVREQSSTGNVIEEYEYDQDGQRVMKIVVGTSGNQTHYYVDKDFVRITNSSGNYDTVYYYLGTNLIGKNASGTICYMHPDHLGSTSLVTNSAGTEDETIEYYPFGGIISTTNEEFLYTSKEKDSSNLNYYEARYYDSDGLRKFTQPDPLSYDLEYLKKYNEQVFNPQALNSFTYVMNNPYKYNDPNGLWTMQIGVSGTAGAGGQVGIGFVIGNNEGGLIPNQAGGYAYGGAGGATLGGGIEFTYSDNDYISDLKGTTVTTGGNIPVGGVEWNLPIGSSANIYNGDKEVERLKSSYSLNIGAFGEVIGFDVHGYVVKTGVLQFVGPERELTCNTEAFSQASNAIQSTDFSNRYTSSKNYFNSLAGGNKDE